VPPPHPLVKHERGTGQRVQPDDGRDSRDTILLDAFDLYSSSTPIADHGPRRAGIEAVRGVEYATGTLRSNRGRVHGTPSRPRSRGRTLIEEARPGFHSNSPARKLPESRAHGRRGRPPARLTFPSSPRGSRGIDNKNNPGLVQSKGHESVNPDELSLLPNL
jgi:hypothetical protein